MGQEPITRIDYTGKKCVVAGGASGMGKLTVEMLLDYGAEVYLLDFAQSDAPVKAYIPIDFGKKEAIHEALVKLPDDIDAVFSTVGIPGVTGTSKIAYGGKNWTLEDVIKINYAGAREFVEGIIPKMVEGGAICLVSSLAAMFREKHFEAHKEFITSVNEFDEIVEYVLAHKDDPHFVLDEPPQNRAYCFTKEALDEYVQWRAISLAPKHIRFNVINPGSTITPMLASFYTEGQDQTKKLEDPNTVPPLPCGFGAEAWHQAAVMIFLNSGMAGYVSGQAIDVDYALGYGVTHGVTGADPRYVDVKK
jgi:NAD(P)-dependent dehydrogenase (short-subunit alcohol dehydrogenase family)